MDDQPVSDYRRIEQLEAALQSFMFDFGQFDSDEQRLREFRRLRKAARPLLGDTAGVDSPDGAKHV